jgi:hypothetical protein
MSDTYKIYFLFFKQSAFATKFVILSIYQLE